MINEGFKTTATKEDIKTVTTRLDGIDVRLDTLDGRVDTLDARLGRIEADVHALRDEMVHRHECEDALDRVKYIEKKLGMVAPQLTVVPTPLLDEAFEHL